MSRWPEPERDVGVASIWPYGNGPRGFSTTNAHPTASSLRTTNPIPTLITRISDSFGIQLPLLSLFDHPTLAGMAAAVERLILDKIELEKTEQGRIEAGNGNELQSTAESAEGIRR